MFIVAMTLAVIAAMGIYALNMASMEVKTAGFIRQQLQTQYLSQYGVSSATQALANNGQMYATIMTGTPDTGCFTLYQIWNAASAPGGGPPPVQAKACHRAGSVELGTEVVPVGTGPVQLLAPLWNSNASDLTRGPVGLPTFPDFFVEVTDPNPRPPPPGYSQGKDATVCFLEVTASSVGLTPTTATGGSNDTFNGNTPGYVSEGFEMSRARVLFGPIQCSSTN
jgi:hypothetical protein